MRLELSISSIVSAGMAAKISSYRTVNKHPILGRYLTRSDRLVITLGEDKSTEVSKRLDMVLEHSH